MISKQEFLDLVDRRGTLVIDGALATELEVRGLDLNHALWSAKVLKEQPESIKQVHYDYFKAGADFAITASYQASVAGLVEHFDSTEDEALELVRLSARLAKEAAAQIQDDRLLLVAGSVGPFGAYLADGSEYRGDYVRTKEEFKAFHRPRIQALIEGGADLLAVETMPQLQEIEAVLEMLKEQFPNAVAWLGCTLKDSQHLSDGTSLVDLLRVVKQYESQVVALGINCIPIGIVIDSLTQMQEQASGIPLLCYPNSGEIWNAVTKTWNCAPPEYGDLGSLAIEWNKAGAKLIGGCCRTGPADIRIIHDALQ